MKRRLHAIVFGDVQGVFFRAGTVGEAKRIGGITGWVRNLGDGSVEVLAEGELEKLKMLLEWCSHGPPGASVSEVRYEWLEYKGEFRDFSIKYGLY